MAPDLNSLPPSTATSSIPWSSSNTPRAMAQHGSDPAALHQNGDSSPTRSPRSASISLQAAATLNAGLQRDEPQRRSSSSSVSRSRPSPTTSRRRSQVLMNLQIADPSVPAPGEMVSSESYHMPSTLRTASPLQLSGSPLLTSTRDPHHARAPSLGELHQELENEQEFQVNRLLQEIRRLQLQVQRQQHQSGQSQSAVMTGDEASDRSVPIVSTAGSSAPQSAHPGHGGFPAHPRSSFDMARADLVNRRSRTPSRGTSPRLRSTSISGESGEQWILGGGRDESAFYQAETQMLIRENQMLRHRIRDLERQMSEATATSGNASIGHEPAQSSHLSRTTSVSEGTPTIGQLPTVADTPKEE